MDKTKLQLLELIGECFDSADFTKLYPYLAQDVERQNSWHPTIVGKEEVIQYLEYKAKSKMHHFNRLALTQYIDGMPATLAQKRIVSAPGSMAGDHEMIAGSQIALWYDENEPVLLLHETFFEPPLASLHLTLNNEGLIKVIGIYNPVFYAFKDHPSCHKLQDYNKLIQAMKYETAMYINDEGYKVILKDKYFTMIPHLQAIKEDKFIPVLIFADISPFKGAVNEDVVRSIFNHTDLKFQFAALIEAVKEEDGYKIVSFELKDIDKVMVSELT